nr:protein PHYTOCHROME KINASE SUBSTRATE 3-like [Ipomoea trifida]
MEADDMSLRVASFSCYLNNPEESLVQRIAGGSSEDLPRPDAPFPVRARASANKPSSNVKIPKAAAMDGSKDHKVKVSTDSDHGTGESFSSSYVRTPENNNINSGFAFKTASGPVEDPTVSFVFPAAAKHLERRIVGKSRNDGEISIFDADKYFNMKLDQKLDLAYTTAPIRSGKVVNKNKNDEIPAVESPCIKPKSSNVSVSSEPSSFGSKAVLLHKPKPRKAGVIRRSFFGRLGCQGRCLDKKAVVIDDHGSKQAAAAEDSFSSQKHSAGNTSKREEHHATTKQEEAVEEQRKSLEVFGAHKTRKGSGDVAVNLERKLSVLTWDAIPNSTTASAATDIHHIAHTTTSNTIYDDMASDASSDLFEIENISDSARHGLMLASQTNTSGCASPITHYAPSEASITWSVVTAGLADHSSVISDYDENTVSINVGKTGKFKDVTGKPSTKPRFTGLLGCNNSHGNLNISETAHNTGGDRRKLGKSIHNCHSPDDFSSPCMT